MDYFQYTTLNRQALSKSQECACIYCFRRYSPELINKFCYDYNENNILIKDTAMCTYCSVDAVVPKSLIDYTDEDLKRWHYHGFVEVCDNPEII
jgi:hypothetical protein